MRMWLHQHMRLIHYLKVEKLLFCMVFHLPNEPNAFGSMNSPLVCSSWHLTPFNTYAWIQPAANWKTLEVREKKQGVSSKQWPSKQLETSGNKFLEFGSKAWMVSKEDAACTSAGPCQTQKQLCTAHQYRTHKCNSRACKDMTKALELFMDVADTKPKHKALGTNGKGCRENLRSSISIHILYQQQVRSEVGVKYRGNRTRTYPYMYI